MVPRKEITSGSWLNVAPHVSLSHLAMSSIVVQYTLVAHVVANVKWLRDVQWEDATRRVILAPGGADKQPA